MFVAFICGDLTTPHFKVTSDKLSSQDLSSMLLLFGFNIYLFSYLVSRWLIGRVLACQKDGSQGQWSSWVESSILVRWPWLNDVEELFSNEFWSLRRLETQGADNNKLHVLALSSGNRIYQ